MSKTLEGVLHNGKIEFEESPNAADGTRALVILMPETFDRHLRSAQQRGLRPSGMPLVLPTPAELRERAERLAEMFAEWREEGTSDDLADADELLAAIERDPVRFHEIQIDE